MNLDQLNDMYIDVLREIGNIGTGNATTAISNMLNLKMDMGVPKVELMPVEKLGEAIGSEEEIVV
jgi:chemotaxis protein CheC